MIGYAIFSATLAFSIMCVAYSGMAKSYGWPVGTILAEGASIPKVMAFVGGILSVVRSFVVYEWWTPVVVIVIGQVVAFILLMTFKGKAQAICVVGTVLGFFFTSLYQSESRPFGFFHALLG
ncbi:MAG: hypothetical protein WCR74_05865 [Betaproteobacteria bacterium]